MKKSEAHIMKVIVVVVGTVMRKKRGENVEGKKGETQKKTEIKK
jgi:hypothetical protein